MLNIFILVSDYFRVLFAFASFYYMPTDPWLASILYIVSGLLDAVDGHLARMLNQGNYSEL
jgi:CDP-diacylglycerol--inositol 3-phosphatidyltransferase